VGYAPREFSPLFWCVVGATFLGFLGIGTVLPGLPLHVRYDLGGSDETVGFVIGVFSFVALAARLLSGPMADRKGRKLTFMTGLASCAIAGAIYLLPLGLPGAYLARILQGFGEACLYTGAATWAVEIAGVHRSSQALGYISSGIWGGISAGPVLGNWVGSFQHAAFVQLLLAGLGFLLLTRVPEHFKPHPSNGVSIWFRPQMLTPGFTIGLLNVHYPVMTGFLILHLRNHGNSGRAAFTSYALVILLSRFFLGSLPDRVNPAVTYYFGVSAMAVGMLTLAAGPPPILAMAAAGLLGLGFSFPWSSIASTLLRRTAEHERGSVVSYLGAFYDLFVGIGSFSAGIVSDRFGYPSAFVMAVAALVLSGAIGWKVFQGAEMSTREPVAAAH
jgi:MFS family permease